MDNNRTKQFDVDRPKIDEGTEFARENLLIAEREARLSKDFAHLLKAIQSEKRKIADVTKTGDLISYYSQFASGEHKHSKDFLALAKAAKESFIPAERMADELKSRFPHEAGNRTEIQDLIPGDVYRNGFLGIVLGGSYASSFRNARFPNTGYLMLNPNKGLNEWRDNRNTLAFCPTGYRYRGTGSEGFVERHLDQDILIFEKASNGDWVYFGIYTINGQDEKYVFLERKERFEGNGFWSDMPGKTSTTERNINSFLSRNTNPKVALLDIVIQRANANCVEFSAGLFPGKRKGDENYRILFPNGFFELFGTFEIKELIISDSSESRADDRRVLSPRIYDDSAGVFGWKHLEEDVRLYYRNFYKHFVGGGPSRSWKSKGGELKVPSANRMALVSLERFAISAISLDAKEQGRSGGDGTLFESPLFEYASRQGQRGPVPDFAIKGFYKRIGIESPAFEFVYAEDEKLVQRRALDFVSNDNLKLVFINLAADKTTIIDAGGSSFLQLGIAFLSQLGRLYPDLLAQYIAPDKDDFVKEKTESSKAVILGKRTKAEDPFIRALENNKAVFKTWITKTQRQIAIITGNGVSIHFGASSWNTLSKELLEALKPQNVRSLKRINDHFGNHSLLTTDFSKYALGLEKPNEVQYWSLLKNLIYGKFNSSKYAMPSATRSIARVKHEYKERIALYTYNYDTFLEDQYSQDFNETLSSVHSPKSLLEIGDEVIHLHGIYRNDGSDADGIILTRTEYYEKYVKDGRDPRSKRGLESLSISLRDRICLFVGSSLTDLFQMMMIQDASAQNERPDSNLIYALLRMKNFTPQEKRILYRYYKHRNVFLIPFEDFNDLPGVIEELFSM